MLQTEVQQQEREQDESLSKLYSVMFSPAEPNLVAAAGCGGTQLLELRQYGPVRYLSIYLHYLLKFNKTYFPIGIRCRHSYPTTSSTNATFNAKGTRLLCREKNQDSRKIVIHKVMPSEQHQELLDEGVVELKSPGYTVPRVGLSACCFAGDEDELVVAPSAVDHNLHIWSVCDGPNGNRSLDQSLLSLSGHQQSLNNVRYSKAISSLASCDADNVIKLWSPTII